MKIFKFIWRVMHVEVSWVVVGDEGLPYAGA